MKADKFLHELRLYQFVNDLYPIIQNPWCKVVYALTYLTGPNTYEWKQSVENWIISIPTLFAPTCTIYDNFEEEFIELWTDTNESYCTAAELDKLCMKHDDVNTYITCFAKLAHKALYHKDNPAVLEKFKAGLSLKLLEKCMHHDDPRNWDAWTRSMHAHQAILTSLKTHQIKEATQQTPSQMKEYLLTPPQTPLTTPPPIPMKIDKAYMIPTRQNLQA